MRYLVSMDYFVANNPIETLSGQTVDFITTSDSTPNTVLMSIFQSGIKPNFISAESASNDFGLGFILGTMLAEDDVTFITEKQLVIPEVNASHKLIVLMGDGKEIETPAKKADVPATPSPLKETPSKPNPPEAKKAVAETPQEEPKKGKANAPEPAEAPVVKEEPKATLTQKEGIDYVDCKGEYDAFPKKVKEALEAKGLIALLEKEGFDKDYVAHQIILAIKMSAEPVAFKIQLRSFINNHSVSAMVTTVMSKSEFYNLMHNTYAFKDN